MTSDVCIILPDSGSELVLWHLKWLRQIAVAHVDADVFTSGRQEDFRERPHSVAPLLKHKIRCVDLIAVVCWRAHSDCERLRASDNVAYSVDLRELLAKLQPC